MWFIRNIRSGSSSDELKSVSLPIAATYNEVGVHRKSMATTIGLDCVLFFGEGDLGLFLSAQILLRFFLWLSGTGKGR